MPRSSLVRKGEGKTIVKFIFLKVRLDINPFLLLSVIVLLKAWLNGS